MRIKVKGDGAEYDGKDALEVVTAMKNSSPFNRQMSLTDYMPKVREWSGEERVQITSPLEFLQSLNTLGYIVIEE